MTSSTTSPPSTFRERFDVHGYDLDAFGQLAVPALSGFLVEAAGLHAQELGVGFEALQAKGLAWVLARQRIAVLEELRMGDVLEIETWPAGIERLAALRHFVVRRGAVEVARAVTVWFALDVATRRPVRLEDVLVDPRFPREPLAPILPDGGKLPALDRWSFQKRFHVRYMDIDVNQHVNNASYILWALEAIPEETWRRDRLVALDVSYLAEGHLGGGILSRIAPAGEGAFAHAVVREEDGKELARAATLWAPR